MEENIGKKLLEISFGNDFLVITPKVSATKAKPDKWGCIKLKSTAKETTNRMKRQPRNGRKYLQTMYLMRE